MDAENRYLQSITRRHFFRDCGFGIGKAALASMMASQIATAAKTHFAPKADRVIFLFMAGGPSHLDMFDYKPALVKLDSQEAPDSVLAGKRFAFMDTFTKAKPKLLGTRR